MKAQAPRARTTVNLICTACGHYASFTFEVDLDKFISSDDWQKEFDDASHEMWMMKVEPHIVWHRFSDWFDPDKAPIQGAIQSELVL